MAKGPTKRVRLNREALHEVTLAVSDGLFELAKQVVTEAGAVAPDSPLDPFPTGEGLPKQGASSASSTARRSTAGASAARSRQSRAPCGPRSRVG
jgi:hypothetical protein